MSLVSASDTMVMSESQQIRVHFAESCVTNPSYAQISQTIAAAAGPSGGNSVASVADVSGDSVATLSNILSVLTNYYVATINPVDGVSVGQLRADITNALQVLSQTAGIGCNNFTVGLIEYDDGKSFLSSITGSGPSVSSTLSLGFIAIIAIVVLVFVKFK